MGLVTGLFLLVVPTKGQDTVSVLLLRKSSFLQCSCLEIFFQVYTGVGARLFRWDATYSGSHLVTFFIVPKRGKNTEIAETTYQYCLQMHIKEKKGREALLLYFVFH